MNVCHKKKNKRDSIYLYIWRWINSVRGGCWIIFVHVKKMQKSLPSWRKALATLFLSFSFRFPGLIRGKMIIFYENFFCATRRISTDGKNIKFNKTKQKIIQKAVKDCKSSWNKITKRFRDSRHCEKTLNNFRGESSRNYSELSTGEPSLNDRFWHWKFLLDSI